MHVAADLNLNWFLQFIVTTFIVGLGIGLHRLVKNTASRFFVVEDPASYSSYSASADYFTNTKRDSNMPADAAEPCAVCGNSTKKRCSRCKQTSYCSEDCQRSHWHSEHKTKCKILQSQGKSSPVNSSTIWKERKASFASSTKTADFQHSSRKILFPYEEFVELFNWDNPGFPPCGLLNCGNSCFANVVLQCLTYTKPLVAYLLVKGHRRECRRNDWCFLCEFQTHLERASRSLHPFSPINILSRLPNMGGNLGYGSQEDAHEFMRFAIDTMQSVCLDEYGGEKAVHPSSQKTTLIQHIFAGQLQSQVICTKCNNISNQLENMMDLTVEIHGDAASLEECLDQFTAKEWLHGDNMYKCDRCNEYVTAWKRLMIRLPPNILTIALKRFQSGRFGKLNKRVTFPEMLDLSPYMSKARRGNNFYNLYAVIVHVDMLNASFFGHYICYVKDFRGYWYRVDDCKVARVDQDEVLSQGAYMLLYSRASARPACLYPLEFNDEGIKKDVEQNEESPHYMEQSDKCNSVTEVLDSVGESASSAAEINFPEDQLCSPRFSEGIRGNIDKVDSDSTSLVKKGIGLSDDSCSADDISTAPGGCSNKIPSGDASVTCTPKEDVMEVLASEPISDHNGDMKADRCTVNDSSFSTDSASGKAAVTSDTSGSYSNGNCEDMPSYRATSGTSRESNGTDYPVKLKPLFSPGFLGKRPQKKCNKKIVDNREPAVDSICRSPSSGSANPNMCRDNHMLTDEGKSDEYRAASSNILSKEAMVDKTIGAGNGDSGSPVASEETMEVTDVKLLDEEELIDEDKPEA